MSLKNSRNTRSVCGSLLPQGAPDLRLKKMEEAEQETKDNQGILLTIAINYGGQAEILHAATEIARQVKAGTLQPDDITKALFEDHLYTRGIPAPDLLIRTGGDLRVSNFLLWQIAYSELWTTDVCWPILRRNDSRKRSSAIKNGTAASAA